MIELYRKKPVTISAVQWTGDNLLECIRFMGQEVNFEDSNKFDDYRTMVRNKGLQIDTLEGVMIVSDGDYIIKGVRGEFYPCKPDIFKETYEII